MNRSCEPSDGAHTPCSDSQHLAPSVRTSRNPVKAGKAGKPKRTRTGCLTCRERHLKCDGVLGRCLNCQKSDRVCRRGVRLNFIDTQTVSPPRYAAKKPGYRLAFRDESRHIASEYVGGFERYPSPVSDVPLGNAGSLEVETFGCDLSPALELGVDQSFDFSIDLHFSDMVNGDLCPTSYPIFYEQDNRHVPVSTERMATAPNHFHFITGHDDILFLRTFIEEIAPWMDTLDASKHFTRILPFHSTEDHMLLKAFMACGARHLQPVNHVYGEKASQLYHETSRELQERRRTDFALCATTSIVLAVYETMCSSVDAYRANHITGANDFIKECRWNSRTLGLGGACLWLRITIEILTCLRYNWSLSCNPDTWGVDMDMEKPQPYIAGNEELWIYRVIYICAKLVNFRSCVSHFRDLDRESREPQRGQSSQEWDTHYQMLNKWAECVPRSLQPLGYLPAQGGINSAFPVVLLGGQSAAIARLFYHIARLALSQTHPFEENYDPDMQQRNAHDLCGIVAHLKDCGLASLSIRFLTFAAGFLTAKRAQEEALVMFDHLAGQAGWQAEDTRLELQRTWGWSKYAISV